MIYFSLLLVIVVSLLEVFGDILFKKWTLSNGNSVLLIAGIIMYFIATICWAFSLKYQNLSKAVILFGVITTVVAVLVGVFVFKENLSVLNIIGIIAGLTGIILLEI